MSRLIIPAGLALLALLSFGQSVVAGVAGDCDFVFPWITHNDRFSADLVFNNLGAEATSVQLIAVRADGNSEQAEIFIESLEQQVYAADALFPSLGSGSGYSVYATTARTSDHIEAAFVVTGRDSCSQSSPAQANVVKPSAAANLLLFKYMPQLNGGTAAPVIVNTGDQTATVTVHGYQYNGKVGTNNILIGANQPYAATIQSLFPGTREDLYLVVQSDQPVVGLSFAFNELGEPAMADAVPLTVLPDGGNDDGDNNGLTGWDAILAKFTDNVQAFVDGNTVVIRTDGVPNHGSPYFGAGDSRYLQPHSGMHVNPNRIGEQNLEFEVPTNPAVAATGSETRLGPIGVALNGVPFFNQYAGRTAAGWEALDNEILSFDIYNGHPAGNDMYHYHFEPVFLTEGDKAALIGVMMDGFPVYGPQDPDGSLPNNLDECNGHTHATAEFPEGIYHYHATTEFPYLNGCFRGESGTVSQ
ncbi:YHYH protein [Acanthopleuribacter pedis]|uniref:YHYH protein n=1 Tax=Acanthopleuribacter pedis TaxID=442870 RepID=A0A8J7QER2_9BACT|nr:YHYH protein [Acanthopleuribacter pedis]MBO1322624.1 YHYH protein [Acanthopleuribacter pedis]